MKKMRNTLAIVLAVIMTTATYAQSNEYKLAMSSGRLIVKEVDEIRFEGHSGNEVIFMSRGEDKEDTERAKGLRLISGLGLEDNTGIGLSVEKDGSSATVNQISRNSDAEYTVKVPKGVTIVYEHSSPHGDDILFKDIQGEIESTTNHSDIELENVTGPLSINTVHGDIEGSFGTVNQSNPISIISAHGDIDLSIPNGTKADMKINTSWGEIYSDLDIALEKNNSSMKRYGANKVVGKLNGGGVSMHFESTHGSIYLRKK